jgi:hypothetical protein
MKIVMILENSAQCELDRQVIDVPDGDDLVDVAAQSVIEGWTLSVGDTIRIVEAR